jgi:molecular chaperone IbpA
MNDLCLTMDRIFEDLFPTTVTKNAGDFSAYPPTDLVKTGDDTYAIVMAVAGFSKEDLHIYVKNSMLFVEGKHEVESEDTEFQYIRKGIARREFRKQFTLNKNLVVQHAELKDGLLTIDLDAVPPDVPELTEVPIF